MRISPWLAGWLATLTCLTPVAAAELSYRMQAAPSLDELALRLDISDTLHVPRGKVDLQRIRQLRACDGRVIAKRDIADAIPPQIRCLEYRFPLSVESRGRFRVAVPDDVRLANPEHFLFLRPTQRAEIRVTGEVPVSHPWVPAGRGSHTINPSPRSSRPQIVIGNYHPLPIEGLDKPAAFVGNAQHAPKLADWLNDVVRMVGWPNGFPNPDLHVVALSARGRGDSPVPFGHVIRNQGETVRLFVVEDRPLDEFRLDWTAAHEFAHLKLPYLSDEGRWISEGFASYYQNVLQARLGHYSQAEAWRRLSRSFARASRTGRGMTPREAVRAPFWQARMMIYWSGAAFAMLADVQLRQMGASLDETLAALQLPASRAWPVARLMEELDRHSQSSVFSDLYQHVSNQKGMPDTTRVFRDLGVESDGRQVHLRSDAPLSHIRNAIMGAGQQRVQSLDAIGGSGQ